ncbi:hypothetical protein ACTXT7_009129 [Hymenolepis weldensis]
MNCPFPDFVPTNLMFATRVADEDIWKQCAGLSQYSEEKRHPEESPEAYYKNELKEGEENDAAPWTGSCNSTSEAKAPNQEERKRQVLQKREGSFDRNTETYSRELPVSRPLPNTVGELYFS